MADGDRVTAPAEVVRYARPADVDGSRINGSAFHRKPKDEDGVSVCRLGVFAEALGDDLRAIRAAMSCRVKLKPNGRLAQIPVAAIEEVGRECAQALFVVEDALAATADCPANPAHALIDGLPFIGAEEGTLEAELASDLLRLRVSQLHPAV